MLTMNEKDKNEMLEAILNENESYQCKLWAVIMAGADTYALIGGLSTLTGGAAAALDGVLKRLPREVVPQRHAVVVLRNARLSVRVGGKRRAAGILRRHLTHPSQ